MAPSASLRVCDDGVAEVTLHNPPVNALHPDRASLPPPHAPPPRAPLPSAAGDAELAASRG